ncbi:methionyl-tRNA formyltransferase [Phtheirospermum japonicum]|uniref:methionyl-tRNA formyltransferase n=1 Tax=Phtheirospermum japonicum TaxID=374723 RepID=A0A830B0J5_9LAMI|nr:methionyl-tRNA formyltransferase [Phtheirospermum japonicum]
MMMVIRNEQEHSETEGSRTKKKKKQDGTSRPACSWVHFSREFIKDYTASHPESSGLKVATKAASDAWKLMSPEEKAKYTNRARETKLVTRCSPGRLLNVLQRLSPDQKAAVKSMGFGSILNLRCRTLRRSLCLWLLEKFNTVRRSLEICGERIPLTPRDVELVMGLSSSGKDVVNSGPDEIIAELRKKYNATNRGISVRLLEERLAAPESGEDFKRSFLLYVLGTLICPTARLDVSPSFLHFLTNMDVVHQYNWGKFLLDRLVRELFYYESVAVGEPSELSPAIFPCLASWGEEEISEREKQERELGGYGCGEVVCKERGLGVGMLGFRNQPDNIHSPIMPPEMETYTLIEQDEYQDEEDQVNGGMIMAEILRRFCCLSAAASSPSSLAPPSSLTTQKKRLVFMGSPQVSASVLDALFSASSASDSIFEIAAIVTQPPSGRDRGRKLMPSPVAQRALDNGFPPSSIFTPVKAGEESFLSSLKALEPELCITAAYGNILPTKFLRIPSMGTVNIHPSLLPLYRGAAPVQRALQDGVRETGVSVAYTVRQLDAGPVIACEKVEINNQIKDEEDQVNGGMIMAEDNMPITGNEAHAICVDIEIADPVRAPCRNAQYGCAQIVDYTKRKEHEDICICSPCACPLRKCHFVGSSLQLSEHFSSKHWDSGRRFQYNSPLPITLNKNDTFLVLQAEKDGILFLLNKGTENIGHTVMITCIGPSSSREQYLYDIVSERGNSCLRLKSYTNNYPGRIEGCPPVDFLLVPYGFMNSSGELDLEMCIWNSTDIGAD